MPLQGFLYYWTNYWGIYDFKGSLVTWPMFSLRAWGQIGKFWIFWKNDYGQCIKGYKKPFNPKSLAQQAHRKKYADSIKAWQALSWIEKQGWEDAIRKRQLPMSGFNYFQKFYIKGLL